MRFLLRMTFELAGHDVAEAADGVAAIERVERNRVPDLVATDFMMPRMNGGELIARLRRDPDHPRQLESRLGAKNRSGRVLPQTVRPRGAHGLRDAAPGQKLVMERIS